MDLTRSSPPSARTGGVRVKGVGDLLVRFGKCCHPIPGDPIVGFITRGRGVSVHTVDCPNIEELAFDKERLVDVSWGDFQPAAHSVKITVRTQDKPGLLASVSSSISAAEANITHAETITDEDKQATLNFTIDITDVEHLNRIMKAIAAVNGVMDVKRVKAG